MFCIAAPEQIPANIQITKCVKNIVTVKRDSPWEVDGRLVLEREQVAWLRRKTPKEVFSRVGAVQSVVLVGRDTTVDDSSLGVDVRVKQHQFPKMLVLQNKELVKLKNLSNIFIFLTNRKGWQVM